MTEGAVATRSIGIVMMRILTMAVVTGNKSACLAFVNHRIICTVVMTVSTGKAAVGYMFRDNVGIMAVGAAV